MTLEHVRAQFPALASGFAFFENAGGSQVPVQVMERMRRFMLEGYVQTGAGYPASDVVDETVAKARAFANVLTNAGDTGLSVIGPSTTDLLYRLCNSLSSEFREGDEVVVGVSNHESNIGPWARLAERGVNVRWWGVDPESGSYDYETLAALLSDRTKVIAVAHTSNLLGDVLDVKHVCRMARETGALSVVDGVAYAPHAAVDAQDFGADFYVFSMYKVFGPHLAVLYGRHSAWEKVKGPNHFFIPEGELPWKFELGCQPYEGLAGLLGVGEYFAFLADCEGKDCDRPTLEKAYGVIQSLERPVLRRLAGGLMSLPDIRLVGPRTSDPAQRHPTFSFVHDSVPSNEVVRQVNGPSQGIRYGHMYAARLCEAMGAPLDTGFVRVSAVHYNSEAEADRLLESLARVN